jgi:uncharacterized protein (DUF2344 family)
MLFCSQKKTHIQSTEKVFEYSKRVNGIAFLWGKTLNECLEFLNNCPEHQTGFYYKNLKLLLQRHLLK